MASRSITARLLTLAVLLAFGGAAWAQQSPLVQSGVVAEATAESAVQARERAHAQARRIAFQRLAQQLGATAPSVSDSQLDAWTQAIIVEQERTSPTRYAGRLTVRFSPAAAAAMGQTVAAATPLPGVPAAGASPLMPMGAGVANVQADARYASFGDWRDIRARLASSNQVAGMEILSIHTQGATLRLSLRSPLPEAAAALAGVGIAVSPDMTGNWQLGLAGGG
ncbi:MAG: hypothetical protein K2X11_05385 [Acetobacteraceae bacterium]|nr:hypothetical protein [Acetobacteraceae bacterium]